jgi:hypothetical protein
MSANGITVGTFAANGSLVLPIHALWGTRFTLLVTGTAGVFGAIALKGGTSAVREVIYVTNPAAGSTHTALAIDAVGAYTFDVCCESMEFVLSGSTTPDLDLVLFPEARP